MRADPRIALRLALIGSIVLTAAVVLAPDLICRVPSARAEAFLPSTWYQRSPDGRQYALGADYLGRPFAPVLVHAASRTMRFAILGTSLVLVGCLVVGTIQGSTRSRGLEALVAAGNLGVMAVPEAAVLIAIATSWPRTSVPLYVNMSMLSVLVAFAVPPGSRLVAERVRALNRAGFVAASRSCGATYGHTLRREIWPHLVEDVAWIVAWTLPRFLAIEVGMAYLGIEYRDFEGLGRLLAKSFSNMSDGTAVVQMLATIVVIAWVALVPQVLLGLAGIHSVGGAVR